MTNKPTGGPAFPTSFNKDYPTEIVGGMTLRDAFAMATLQSVCVPTGLTHEERAAWVYAQADAMILEREK